MNAQRISARIWAELLFLGLIWGGVFIAIRYALDEIGVLHAVAHRMIWGALVLWAYVLIRGLRVPFDAGTWGAFLVQGLLNNILPFTLLTWSQTRIESGLAAIFNSATALFGVLVAAMFLADERLSRRKAAGVIIGFAGVTIAIGWESLTRFDPRSLAQIAALAATLCYAFAGVWARKKLGHLPPQVSATGMVTASAIVMLALSWMVEGPLPLDMTARTWAATLYFAVVATALAYLVYYHILAAAGAGNLSLVTLVIPPVAIVLGAVLRSETLPPDAILGFAIIALGLLILDGRLFGRR